VVADCIGAPGALATKPGAIVLACADNGLGVQRITWTSWTATGATGRGTLWEKLCQPNCAEGKIGYYPVQVTLSDARASASGQWFRSVALTWGSPAPPAPLPPGTYQLLPPG
jgi:hypothetical protein